MKRLHLFESFGTDLNTLDYVPQITRLITNSRYDIKLLAETEEGLTLAGKKLLLDKDGRVSVELSNSLIRMIGSIIITPSEELNAPIISAQDVMHLIEALHQVEEDDNIEDRVMEAPYYMLIDLPIDKVDAPWYLDDDKVADYVAMHGENSNYPPIVVDKENQIIDGMHRYETMRQLGHTTIKAYKPTKRRPIG